MKKISIYTVFFVSALFMGSCSDSFLDSEPLTSLTDANFYRTPSDAEKALVSCYEGLQLIYSDGIAFPLASEILSDNTFGATGNNDGYGYQLMDEFDITRSPGDLNMFENNWVNYYRALYRVNVLLQKMDQINWGTDESRRLSIEAQARFLRAFFYFDMVRLWEKVPLLTIPSRENIPQSEPAAIYAQIAEDLLFTATHGSETVSPGRVNKWVAKSFIARVFLFYTGYYEASDLTGLVTKAQALQHVEDVIEFNHYGLITEFKNLWPAASSWPNAAGTGLETSYAGKDNKETIFSIKYNITSNYNGKTDGNHWLVMLGLREQSFSPYGRGWGSATVDPLLYNAFEANDSRKVASIIAIEEEGINFLTRGQREYTGYTVKKYTPLANPNGQDVAEANGATNFMIGQFQDFVSMRYADVLLMAAELGSANAQNYFDQVRQRAGLTSKPVNKANIMEERRLEFAFEGIRYWDLLRQGLQHAATTIARTTTVQNGGVPVQKVIKAENVIKTRGFQLIPHNQITLSNGVLKQNQGWN
jgi:starch-binding outer membrane protein, SusD/RagB family